MARGTVLLLSNREIFSTLYYINKVINEENNNHKHKKNASLVGTIKTLNAFVLVAWGLVFFRIESIDSPSKWNCRSIHRWNPNFTMLCSLCQRWWKAPHESRNCYYINKHLDDMLSFIQLHNNNFWRCHVGETKRVTRRISMEKGITLSLVSEFTKSFSSFLLLSHDG